MLSFFLFLWFWGKLGKLGLARVLGACKARIFLFHPLPFCLCLPIPPILPIFWMFVVCLLLACVYVCMYVSRCLTYR